MFLSQLCWNCHKDTRLVAPEFRCEHCQAVNTPEISATGAEEIPDLADLNLSINLPNVDISAPKLPKEEPKLIVIEANNENNAPLLSNDLQRVSIKHLIKLEKPAKAKPVAEIPVIKEVEKTPPPPPVVPRLENPEETIQISPQNENTSLLDMPQIQPVNEVPPVSKANDFLLENVKPIIIKDVEQPDDLADLNLSVKIETPVIQKVENKVQEKQGKEAIAWLILYTENKVPVYYDLYEGDNVFGRADARNPVDIELTGDNYVSRAHAFVTIQWDKSGKYVYLLKDDGTKRNPISPSLNGTFINGYGQRLPKEIAYPLKDGDTIQIGETKLVFKTKEISINLNHAVKEVLDSQYIKTVQVGK
ncbi:MAG: FHA domain-containing protein [Bacteroidia bacterium]